MHACALTHIILPNINFTWFPILSRWNSRTMPRYKMESCLLLRVVAVFCSTLILMELYGIIWPCRLTLLSLYFDSLSFTDVYVPRLVQQFSYKTSKIMEWKMRVQCKLRLCLLPSLIIIIAVCCLAYMKIWLPISKSQWFRLVGRVSEILGSIDFMWFAKCITCNITWPYFCIFTVRREKISNYKPAELSSDKSTCPRRLLSADSNRTPL